MRISPALYMLPVIMALLFGATAAAALELLMFRRAGCPWCAAWDREVGPVYSRTELGQRAPVRFVDLDHVRDTAGLKSPVRFTPTFVLFDGGREIGRIEGYPGQDFFWGLLENLVPKPPGGSVTRAAPAPGG
jgi:thioredoxin-related protein